MIDRVALVRLAGLVGIQTHYTDALGQPREAADEALLAVIGAFGLPSDPTQAAAELQERERAAPLGLSPTYLVHAEEPYPKLVLRTPARAREIVWICRLEDGGERSGRMAITLAVEGSRAAVPLPPGLPLGYHRLAVEAGSIAVQLDLIVAPARCHLPPQLGNRGAQLGPDLPALWAAQRARLGNRRFQRSRRSRRRRRRRWRRGARRQPFARAVRGRASAFQSLFAIEPDLPRLSVHRPDGRRPALPRMKPCRVCSRANRSAPRDGPRARPR